MQEQNFEKQVQKKMEELSFTPSEPVWRKVEEEIRKKKDRKRIFFWIVASLLLLAGGLWLVNKNRDTPLTTATKEIKQPDINSTKSFEKKIPIEKKQNPSSIVNTNDQKPNALQIPPKGNLLQKEQTHKGNEISKRTPLVKYIPITRPDTIKQNFFEKETSTNISTSNQNIFETKEGSSDNGQKEAQFNDSSVVKTIIETNKLKEPDNRGQTALVVIDKEKDSTVIETSVAAGKEMVPKKWKLGITAGMGKSGIDEGLNLFGGGAMALEANSGQSSPFVSNAFNGPAAAYKPPSPQEKSVSFSLGLFVKKQISKRSSFSTGLRYNYYSTQMLVGQSLRQDTTADQNKRINQFYANSGISFSNYSNKFHFISLPMIFDFQIIKSIPLNFHLGLSLQQLISTNALLYSASSRIYYNDKASFNKTHLFSQSGLSYLFPLSKKLAVQFGPEVSYSHSRVVKGSSGQHLFSYGLSTQFIFFGK
jgi:hypothetical protein